MHQHNSATLENGAQTVWFKAKLNGKVEFYDFPQNYCYYNYKNMSTTTTTTTEDSNTDAVTASSCAQLSHGSMTTNHSTMDQPTVNMLVQDAFANTTSAYPSQHQNQIVLFFKRLKDSTNYFLSKINEVSVNINEK
eukprot:15150419-Ditylum_brightwellii.AAC.1